MVVVFRTINNQKILTDKIVELPEKSSIIQSITPPPFTPTASPTGELQKVQESLYPIHKKIYATLFWVGEDGSDDNDYIANQSSAWDSNWLESYGGVDTPYARNGYHPKSFTPKENPFYFALPYNDFNQFGKRDNSFLIPWYDATLPDTYSQIKNRWVKLNYKNTTCYAQWEDVGPFEENDFDYVFNSAKPKEKRAGIDLSPAVKTCLHMATNGFIDWQFVDTYQVPAGPWKEIVTTSQTNWQ